MDIKIKDIKTMSCYGFAYGATVLGIFCYHFKRQRKYLDHVDQIAPEISLFIDMNLIHYGVHIVVRLITWQMIKPINLRFFQFTQITFEVTGLLLGISGTCLYFLNDEFNKLKDNADFDECFQFIQTMIFVRFLFLIFVMVVIACMAHCYYHGTSEHQCMYFGFDYTLVPIMRRQIAENSNNGQVPATERNLQIQMKINKQVIKYKDYRKWLKKENKEVDDEM